MDRTSHVNGLTITRPSGAANGQALRQANKDDSTPRQKRIEGLAGLCRTRDNSLPYFHQLFAVLSSEYGKGPVRPRQRVSLPTAKNRTASPKGTSGLGQSAAQTSPKSPSDHRQVPVDLASKDRRLVLETLRAIDSEPSGHWRQAVGLLETSRRAFAANQSGYWIKAVGLSLDYSFSIVRDDLSLATETFAATYRAFGHDPPRPLP